MSQPSGELERADAIKSRRFVERFSSSKLFKDYQGAFRKATGLPLALRPLSAFDRANARYQGHGSPFCALMARTNHGCEACLKVQERLEAEAGLEPRTLRCFAGLCDSAVPIRVGEQLIAFLETGQVLLHQPNKEEFSRTAQQLIGWGAQVNLKEFEEAYFQTQVLDRAQYEALVKLLATFAEHLAVISNSLSVGDAHAEPKVVANAKRYIQSRYQQPISLDEAARAVNASTRHFCQVFKEATGMTFTEYLSRVRVEKAKHLLQNPQLRISEIAFDTGFESISQFNRTFKRIAGATPSAFRHA